MKFANVINKKIVRKNSLVLAVFKARRGRNIKSLIVSKIKGGYLTIVSGISFSIWLLKTHDSGVQCEK